MNYSILLSELFLRNQDISLSRKYSCSKLQPTWVRRKMIDQKVPEYNFKATGGSRVKKICWSYLKDFIVMVSTLFTEYQNFTPFRSYWCFNVLALWLFYSNLKGHFWHFLHFFWLETNTSKFCIKVYFNGLFWMKNFDLEIFVGFGWFWLIWAKNSVFLQKVWFKGFTRKFVPSVRNELQ